MPHVPCLPAHPAPCVDVCSRATLCSSAVHQCSYVSPRVAGPCRRVARTRFVLPGDAISGTRNLLLAGMQVVVDATTTPPGLVPPLDEPRNVPPLLHTTAMLVSSNPPPSSRRLFPRAQPKVHRSVPYVWPQTPTTPESVVPRPFGMAPKPDARKAKREGSSPQREQPCAAIGTVVEVVPPPLTSNATNAQDAETRIMGLRGALERRKNQALTPYKVEAWSAMLHRCNLLVKYPRLIHSLHKGFDAGIRPIYLTSTPP